MIAIGDEVSIAKLSIDRSSHMHLTSHIVIALYVTVLGSRWIASETTCTSPTRLSCKLSPKALLC